MIRQNKAPDIPVTEQLQKLDSCLSELKLYKIRELLAEEFDRLGQGKSSATQMLLRLFQAQAQLQRERRIERRTRESKLEERRTFPDLLVIDELGFDRLEQEDARNASLFFKVVDGRYNKKSIVLTTNIDFEQLGHYLGDPVVTTAIVDRLVHHSTVITINGPSWRLNESEKLNKRTGQRKKQAKQTRKSASKKRSSPRK